MRTKLIIFTLFALLSTQLSAQKPVVGIALGGGGALGYAHIGVLKALEEAGIVPTVVAGSSMGALVGTFYAGGLSPEELCGLVYQERIYDSSSIFDFVVRTRQLGLSSHSKVAKIFQKYIPHDSFDSLEKKMVVAVTDLTDSKELYISTGGNLRLYTLASMSIPVIFEAIEIDGHVLVDGGTLDNLPATAIRDKCDILIGVDVSPAPRVKNLDTMEDIITECLNLTTSVNEEPGRKACDHLITSYAIEKYSAMDFSKFEEIYLYGYLAAKNYLSDHPELLKIGKQVSTESKPKR